MTLPYPRRKQWIYSLASTEVHQGADQWKGVTKVGYTPKVEGRSTMFGQGTKGIGKNRGRLVVECGFSFEAASFYEWAKSHPQYLDEEFDLTILVQEGTRREVIELQGVTFEDNPVEFEGDSGTEIEISGTCIDILINGESPMHGDALGQTGAAGAA